MKSQEILLKLKGSLEKVRNFTKSGIFLNKFCGAQL